MAKITLYDAQNNKYVFNVGRVIPHAGGGACTFARTGVVNGTVNGVSLPSLSERESGNMRSTPILDVLDRGDNFFVNGRTYYTRPNQLGSRIECGYNVVHIYSGSWHMWWGDKSGYSGLNFEHVSFVFVEGTALSQYDDLTLFVEQHFPGWADPYQTQIYYGGYATYLRFIFCNDLTNDLQTRWNSGNTIFTTVDTNGLPIGGDDVAGFEFEGDVIEMPDAPDETISGALAHGFLNFYAPSDVDIRNFGSALWTNAFNTKWYDLDSIANLVLNAVSDPIDFIVGLFMLPVRPTLGGTSGIYLGGINCNTVNAPRIANQFKTVDFGTITIEELYGNYLDYANSHLSIYLPYVGTADIDVQEVNGGSVSLKYTIDCFTGACVANVHCRKETVTPWGQTYVNETVHSFSGNVAIQLPISAGSFDTMLNGLVNIGLGLGANSPITALKGVGETLQGISGDATTRGSLSSNTGKLGYQTPYLMFTRPIETRPAYLGNMHGYSAGVGGKLSSFSGFVVCSDVKLDGVTATDSELNEIETMLKSGVYV